MRLIARAPDTGSFTPFGAFLLPPLRVGDRSVFDDWLAPVPGLTQRCYLNRVAPSFLPLEVDRVERHPHSAQLFLPVGVSRYLVTVMPSDEAGGPDPRQALSFVVPGTIGVVYHPGVWHAGIAALDAEASFAVFMLRGGGDDDAFAPIAPIQVHGGPGHG